MTIHLNRKEKCLVNGDNGDIIRPSCWDDLSQYHSYLISKGLTSAAEGLLNDVVYGKKVISEMIGNSQKMNTTPKLDWK